MQNAEPELRPTFLLWLDCLACYFPGLILGPSLQQQLVNFHFRFQPVLFGIAMHEPAAFGTQIGAFGD